VVPRSANHISKQRKIRKKATPKNLGQPATFHLVLEGRGRRNCETSAKREKKAARAEQGAELHLYLWRGGEGGVFGVFAGISKGQGRGVIAFFGVHRAERGFDGRTAPDLI